MLGPIYPAISALTGFGQKLGVTANNLANVNTDGFKKSRAVFEEASPGGVIVTINKVNSPGSPLPPDRDTGNVAESSNVTLEEEMVSLITTQHGYTANAKMVQAEEDMLGTVLDILDK